MPETCLALKKDGTRCGARPQSNGFCVFHKNQGVADVAAEVVEVRAPAKLQGLHRASTAEVNILGHKSKKMLRPICHICADNTERAGWGWWDKCPHEPYIGEKGTIKTTPVYKDAVDEDGNLTGERYIESTSSVTLLKPWPNYVAVPDAIQIDSGRSVHWKREFYGFIMPSELRCAAYPYGIADSCEYRNCYWQNDLVTYNSGTYCQLDEAVMAYELQSGVKTEIVSMLARQDQFETSRSKVRVIS